MRAPNVLIFCVDEMRADHLGGRGRRPIRTPNLDALAAQGLYFPRAYCNNPICMPARATMFTGLLPRDHGVRINGQPLRRDVPTLAGVLAEAGYRTHAAGKLHLTPWRSLAPTEHAAEYPEDLDFWNAGTHRDFPCPYYGFQTVDFMGGHTSFAYGPYLDWLKAQGGDPDQLKPPPGADPDCYPMALPEELHYNRWIADSALRTIDQAVRQEQPFFIWCSFPDPHAPIAAPQPYSDLYRPADMPLPRRRAGEAEDLPGFYREVYAGRLAPNGCRSTPQPDERWQRFVAMTYAMITHVDAEMGRVLAGLRAAGQDQNTLIIFISDHGDMMGDHNLIWKAFFTFQGCINIPLIVVPPGGCGGQTTPALAAQMDLLPTVLDVCGVPMPGQEWQSRKTPFSRGAVQPLVTYPGKSWRPLWEGRQKQVRDAVVIENDDPTMGFRVRCLVTERYRLSIYPGLEEGELFDLQQDPDELHNRWSDPACAGLRARLTAQLLDQYSAETPWFPIPPWNA